MSIWYKAASLPLFLASLSGAAQLVLPGAAFERDHAIVVTFRTGHQATGKGTLHVQWTDNLGRVVEDQSLPAELTDENEIRFPLDLTRAIGLQNHLQVHFSFVGKNKKGQEDRREEDAESSFVARPPSPDWWDYMIMMWQDGSADHFARLQPLGINAGKSSEHSNQLPESLLKNNLPWYVENIATDFYSAYHIYRADRPYNYALLQAKELYRKDPSNTQALKRYPSFSDPVWLDKIHDRLVESTRIYSPYRPIFYNLADESGIAELAGFWDFDFSDQSLDAMRSWLKDRYGTLAALNQQWGTQFTDWNLVTPETTRQAMKRADENYSSWGDFKEWMDIAFAHALKLGADAIHSVDPHAYVGIEGAQMPGWGGYDYARLSASLDAMEPYDIGDNIEILRSLNPKLAFVTTAFASGPLEKHRVWYELLHGARGHIIWDEKNDIVQADGAVGARGRDVAPYWNELRDGIGALMINSVRQADPIAIHYSQASMRTDWMLAQRGKGDAWLDRMSWTERKDSDFLRLRDSYCRLVEDHGLQYNFVSYGQVEQGELSKRGYRMLILPRSSSLSRVEADAITAFVRQGGTLVIDGDAGSFDEHSRRLPESSLAPLLAGDTGRGRVVRMEALQYRDQRVTGAGTATYNSMSSVLATARLKPAFQVLDSNGTVAAGVETHNFLNGGIQIVGLLSNPPMEVDDLGPLKAQSEQRFEKTRHLRLIAPADSYAYDIRSARSLGKLKEIPVTLDGYEPTLIAFSPTPLPQISISSPKQLKRGESARIGLALSTNSPTLHDVFHVKITAPGGKVMTSYSGNFLTNSGAAEINLPIALNDPSGPWTIAAKDLLSGQAATATIEVE